MLPWKLRKRQILPVSQNLSLVYFSPAKFRLASHAGVFRGACFWDEKRAPLKTPAWEDKFRLVSSNLSLAIIWQMTYTQKLSKPCSATLKYKLHLHTSPVIFMSSLYKKKKWENVYSTVLLAPGRAVNIK